MKQTPSKSIENNKNNDAAIDEEKVEATTKPETKAKRVNDSDATDDDDEDGFIVLDNKPPSFQEWRDEPIDITLALDLTIAVWTLHDAAKQPVPTYLAQPLAGERSDSGGLMLRVNVTRLFDDKVSGDVTLDLAPVCIRCDTSRWMKLASMALSHEWRTAPWSKAMRPDDVTSLRFGVQSPRLRLAVPPAGVDVQGLAVVDLHSFRMHAVDSGDAVLRVDLAGNCHLTSRTDTHDEAVDDTTAAVAAAHGDFDIESTFERWRVVWHWLLKELALREQQLKTPAQTKTNSEQSKQQQQQHCNASIQIGARGCGAKLDQSESLNVLRSVLASHHVDVIKQSDDDNDNNKKTHSTFSFGQHPPILFSIDTKSHVDKRDNLSAIDQLQQTLRETKEQMKQIQLERDLLEKRVK